MNEISDRAKKLAIARAAYKEIKNVIDKFENNSQFLVTSDWDGCITVDDEFFQGSELLDEK
jgi:hypothetical protein